MDVDCEYTATMDVDCEYTATVDVDCEFTATVDLGPYTATVIPVDVAHAFFGYLFYGVPIDAR